MNRTLLRLLNEGRLRRHRTSKEEVANLLAIVDRDIKDAEGGRTSPDRAFAIAYNAALQLANLVLGCAGYRSHGLARHATAFAALAAVLGEAEEERGQYFDDCRVKRNALEYDSAGRVSEAQAKELLRQAKEFRSVVLAWLAEHHPGLLA